MNKNDDNVKVKILLYLKDKVKDFKCEKAKGASIFTCPSCLNEKVSAHFTTTPYNIECENCKYSSSIIDTAFMLDESLRELEAPIQIAEYLNEKYGIKFPEIDRKLIKFYFDFYEKNNFDLVPLVRGTKCPFEEDWTKKDHKNRKEWEKWWESHFNIGIKTGQRSNITVIDIDTKEIPDIFKELTCPIQSTQKGFHYLFKYVEDLPSTRIGDLKIDILNEGRQFVCYPSMVEGIERVWSFKEDIEIPVMPENIKEFIKSNLKDYQKQDLDIKELLQRDITNNIVHPDRAIEQGNRNNTLIRLGGILRKKLNMDDTQYVLELFNNNYVKPPLSSKELYMLVKTLDKYIIFDEKELAKKIFDYLLYAEEGSSQDIERAVQDKKDRIDKALSFLVKEKIIVKRGRYYHLIKKIEWRQDFPSLCNEVPFKMPYFDDVAVFNWGDLILLGGQSGYGKTTISMNFIKRFKDQGITPHYICLETGSRFIKTACHLGLKEGDFKWSIQTDPSKIEIEKNSITILDWLMIEDKAQTDTVMKYFVEQLVKTNGFLIIFMQLKEDSGWFAPNMVKQFPAFASRYIYDEDGQGITGAWRIDKIREAKRQGRGVSIPCRYYWEDKTLRRIDEIVSTPSTNVSNVTSEGLEVVV